MMESNIAKPCAWALAGAIVLAAVGWGVSGYWATWRTSKEATEPIETAGQTTAKSTGTGNSAIARRTGQPADATAAGTWLTNGMAADNRTAERELSRLQKENQRLRTRLDDMLNWIIDNVRGTYPLPEEQMANLKIAPVDADMAVTDDLAQLLRLSEEETGKLDGMFMESRAVLMELESENIEVTNPADHQVVLNIPPYAETGETVRETLYADLRQTLGAARFDRFLQVAESGLDEQFDYFGASDRTLSFEAFEDETSGEAQLFVRDERARPDEGDPQRINVTISERIVNELPAEYYAYWPWLPEYVTGFSTLPE